MYKQTTYETCLACCLLSGAGIRITKKLELETITHSMKFSKHDFVGGHLDFMKIFPVKLRKIIRDIDLTLVDELIEKRPIVYVDSYCLFGKPHLPHFITVLEKKRNGYVIYDPWDGKKKLLSEKKLSNGISLLKNYIKLKSHIIVIERK